jgi:ornithine--oxo-acid transaminase
MERCLLMNTGAEAVETAIKAARRWGYEVKKVRPNRAEIIVFGGNFHGRTTTIISFSDSPESQRDFGPLTPGFVMVPYGNLDAVRSAITADTVAVLVEPIQGEGGVIIPPEGFLRSLRQLCREERVLFVADEIQTGLCRTGKVFACEHEEVHPDMYILGKSLGGGIVPISAVLASGEILDLLIPGSHGSTFGGNPFACAIARDVVAYIKEERPEDTSAYLGSYLLNQLRQLRLSNVIELRGRGLFLGIDVNHSAGKAKEFCHRLKDRGILCKDTRTYTIRLSPPLVTRKDDLDWALEQIKAVLER